MDIQRHDALIVVDVQNDFLPGGTLAVAQGMRVIEPINSVTPLFSYVIATRDWHPREHPHFRDHGGTWPYHCIQNTLGARFADELDILEFDEILDKGAVPPNEGYDAFEACDLAERLRARGIRRIFVAGLATDYCVKATAIAAATLGFETFVLRDAIAAVERQPGDGDAAIEEMRAHGVAFIDSTDIRTAA